MPQGFAARGADYYNARYGQPTTVTGTDYDPTRNGIELGSSGVSIMQASVDLTLPNMNLSTQTGDVNITEAKQSVLVILAVIAMMILLFRKG